MNFEMDIILENDKVKLESLMQFHIQELLPISEAHPDLLQYSPSPFGTDKKLKSLIESALNLHSQGIRYPFAIFDTSSNSYVGSTSFGNLSLLDKRIEIGWTWIDRKVQGTGLNLSCKYLLMNYAFEHLHMERIEFRTDARNLQSRKAIEKIGAVFEGTLRSHTLLENGFRRDTVVYSVLKEEWNHHLKSNLISNL
ncbi:MAG: GNAT family protein [Bacteroidia bacterium]